MPRRRISSADPELRVFCESFPRKREPLTLPGSAGVPPASARPEAALVACGHMARAERQAERPRSQATLTAPLSRLP